MGKKGRWFDTVQRILGTSGPDAEEKEEAKKAEKSKHKKLWQFSKSSSSGHSTTSAAPLAQQQPHPPPPSQPVEIREDRFEEAESDQPSPVVAAVPRAPALSREELAAIKIQTACRGYLARRALQERGQARLMLLMEGFAVKRQTEDALHCMQAMTRVQTQIHTRRAKTEEDKKALKSQSKIKKGLDKSKIGEGWDHGHQSKEQMEAVLAMKQEAASRRQKSLTYAFSNQWRNRNRKPSSARSALPPMFMDPGNPNWGWSWAERWMAAARSWESQTAPDSNVDRVAAVQAKGSGAGRTVAARRGAMSVQIPAMAPGRLTVTRPPSCPSPSTPRSPSVFGARVSTAVAPASPGSSPLHRSMSGLRRTTSAHTDRPRSSQEHVGSGSGSPLHAGNDVSLRRTSSLRSGELPRRLNLQEGAAAAAADGDTGEATTPVTPSYMQPTKSVRAKTRASAAAAAAEAADKVELPDQRSPADRVSSPSVKKRLSVAFADKPSVSSPSKAKAVERAKRQLSQPPSPRV